MIQFVAADGKRRSVRLGKVTKRYVDGVKFRVEALANSVMTRHPVDGDTAGWVGNLESKMYDKLARVGLVAKRESAVLGVFVEGWIESRTDTKKSTQLTYMRAKRKLLEYFDAERGLETITRGDADEFARWLRAADGGGLAEATARKTASICKQFFKSAVRKRLLVENPFDDLIGTVPANRGRDFFVTREDADAVLGACPDAEWRLLFVLARYGGLRCPSETLGLRWEDVDWSRNQVWVRSPKTEHHSGKEGRWIHLFPELAPYLLEVFSSASDGEQKVITRYRWTTQNLGTQLRRIIRRAGLTPWPKLWQNLRATRETELAGEHPIHVASAWIGNSVAVAAKHYLQVTEEDFQRALGQTEALQNPVQQRAHGGAGSGNERRQIRNSDSTSRIGCVSGCKEPLPLGDKGLEPPTSRV